MYETSSVMYIQARCAPDHLYRAQAAFPFPSIAPTCPPLKLSSDLLICLDALECRRLGVPIPIDAICALTLSNDLAPRQRGRVELVQRVKGHFPVDAR